MLKISNIYNSFFIDKKSIASNQEKHKETSKRDNLKIIQSDTLDISDYKDRIDNLKKIENDIDFEKINGIKKELNENPVTAEMLSDIIIKKIKEQI